MEKEIDMGRVIRLADTYFRHGPGFRGYTGTCWTVGYSDDPKYNTPLARRQLAFALALSGHETVHEIVKECEKSDACGQANWGLSAPLIVDKVLNELKILDLGCGKIPSFARVSRYLGADVYTVDVLSAVYEFECSEDFPENQRKLELEKHIEVNLNDPDAVETILKESGGDFDLVTSAHLTTGAIHSLYGDVRYLENLEELAFHFLKPFGVAYMLEFTGEELIMVKK